MIVESLVRAPWPTAIVVCEATSTKPTLQEPVLFDQLRGRLALLAFQPAGRHPSALRAARRGRSRAGAYTGGRVQHDSSTSSQRACDGSQRTLCGIPNSPPASVAAVSGHAEVTSSPE